MESFKSADGAVNRMGPSYWNFDTPTISAALHYT